MAPETSSPKQLEDTNTHKQDMGRPTVVPSLRWKNWNRPAREFSWAPLKEATGDKVLQIIFCGCLQAKMPARNNITLSSCTVLIPKVHSGRNGLLCLPSFKYSHGDCGKHSIFQGQPVGLRLSYIKHPVLKQRGSAPSKGSRHSHKTGSESKNSRNHSRFPPTQLY